MSWIKQVTASTALKECLEELVAQGKLDLIRFAMMTPIEVVEMCNVDEPVAANAIRKARQLANYSPVKRLSKDAKQEVVPTGIKEFDEKTPWNGIPKYSIQLIAGAFGAGKSIFAMQVAANAIAQGYKPVYYIDTENAFNERMMNALLKRFLGKTLAEVLDVDLIVVKVADAFALEELVKFQLPPEVMLIIIDSVIEPYRAQFPGRERLAARQQRLHYLVYLLRLRTFLGATVILTNQVMAKPELFGEGDVPAGGNILLHTANMIWKMRRKGQDAGYIEALDVPGVARGTKYSYTIRDDGLY